MIETTIRDPEKHETVRADSQGRVSLGVEYADHEVELVVVEATETPGEVQSVQQVLGDRPMTDDERKGMLFVRSFGLDPDCLVADHDATVEDGAVDAETVGLSDVDWATGLLVDAANVARFRFDGAEGETFAFSDEPTAQPVGVTADDDTYDEPVYCYENEAGETTAIAQTFVENVGRIYGYDPTEALSHVRVHPETGPYPVMFRDPDGETRITVAPRVAD